jgi:hypothetical protein
MSAGDGREEPQKKKKYVLVPRTADCTGPGDSKALGRGVDELALRTFSKTRHELIAEAAFYRSQKRRPGQGSPDDDWLQAEAEIDALLRRS